MQDNQNYYVKENFIKRGYPKRTLFKNEIINHILYFFISLFIPLLIFINRLFNRNNKNYKYTVSLCGIFKNEAKFLDEWIQFHIVIGIDHFYLYNNNSDDNYNQILKPYIEKGIVDLIDWPFNHSQMDAYKDCYTKYKNDTNWLTFIDIDEYICPISTDNIKSWLKSFKNHPGVGVYWKQFGSNGKLHHNDKELVIEQYTQCWPKPSVYTKMFCNMDFPITKFKNPHILNSKIYGIKIPPINQYKKIMTLGIHRSSMFSSPAIQINHYWGKAYDSFVENKINRTDVYHADSIVMGQQRKILLKSHEAMCTDRDYSIQRFLLFTKLRNSI